jgi:Lon protease-like protein
MPKTSIYGLFALNLVLVPGERIPLHIFEPRYRELFADCVLEDRPFVVVHSDEGVVAPVGCTARFDELVERHDDGRLSVIVSGIAPVALLRETDGRLYTRAECQALDDDPRDVDAVRVTAATERFRALAKLTTGQGSVPDAIDGVAWSYVLAAHIELSARVKQAMLEARDELVRLTILTEALDLELAAAERAQLAAERAPTNGKVPHE